MLHDAFPPRQPRPFTTADSSFTHFSPEPSALPNTLCPITSHPSHIWNNMTMIMWVFSSGWFYLNSHFCRNQSKHPVMIQEKLKKWNRVQQTLLAGGPSHFPIRPVFCFIFDKGASLLGGSESDSLHPELQTFFRMELQNDHIPPSKLLKTPLLIEAEKQAELAERTHL